MGLFQKAIADFDTAIQLDAGNADSFYMYTRDTCIPTTANTTRRSPILTPRIALTQIAAELHLRRACVYVWKREYDKAIADCNKAIDLDPKFNCLRNARIEPTPTKVNMTKPSPTITRPSGSLRTTRQWYMFRGRVFSMKGAFDKALPDARTAIKLDPKNEEARSLRDWINQRTAKIIKETEGFPQCATTAPAPTILATHYRIRRSSLEDMVKGGDGGGCRANVQQDRNRFPTTSSVPLAPRTITLKQPRLSAPAIDKAASKDIARRSWGRRSRSLYRDFPAWRPGEPRRPGWRRC